MLGQNGRRRPALVALLLMLTAVTTCAGGRVCIRGWHRAGGSCYKATRRLVNRDAAMRSCQRLGGSLVSLNTAEEKERLVTWLHRMSQRLEGDSYGLSFYWTSGQFMHVPRASWVWSQSDGSVEPISREVWSLSGSGHALQPGTHTYLGLYVPQFSPTTIGLINTDPTSLNHALCERPV